MWGIIVFTLCNSFQSLYIFLSLKAPLAGTVVGTLLSIVVTCSNSAMHTRQVHFFPGWLFSRMWSPKHRLSACHVATTRHDYCQLLRYQPSAVERQAALISFRTSAFRFLMTSWYCLEVKFSLRRACSAITKFLCSSFSVGVLGSRVNLLRSCFIFHELLFAILV